MGFDLFMGGLAVVAAGLATWLIILYFRSPSSEQSSVETALQGLRNLNPSSDNSTLQTNEIRNGNGRGLTEQVATGKNTGTEAQVSRIMRLLIFAIVLTVIVFIPSLLSRFSASLVPNWLVNPWVQAILTTPTMFWCGAPIHREGWHALSRRAPDVNSLISLGATGAFIYSLAICVAGNQFPEGSRHAYFGGVNVIITLALTIELVEVLILRDVEKSQNSINPAIMSQAASSTTKASASNEGPPSATNYGSAQGARTSSVGVKASVSKNNSPLDPQTSGATTIATNASVTAHALADRAFNTLIAGIRKLAHFTRIFVITVIIIAVWAFALLVVFGPQPRLTFALFGGVGVLVIAGFILAILALVLIINGRRKAQRNNIN